MRSLLKITIAIAIQILFFMALATNSEASKIQSIRYYTEKDKTRLVIELDQDAKYQTKYDKDHNLSISLVKSKIGDSQKSYKVNNGLVNLIELREEPGNKVSINVSLTKPAAFNVFPLDSPPRIVVDAMPFENIIAPEVISVTKMESGDLQTDEGMDQEETDSENALFTDDKSDVDKSTNIVSNINDNGSGKKSWFAGSDYGIVSAFFDVLILGIIIYMDIKMTNLLKVSRVPRRNRKEKKEIPVLAGLSSHVEHE